MTGIGGVKARFKFRDADGRDLSGGRSEVKAETPVEAIGLVVEAVSGAGLAEGGCGGVSRGASGGEAGSASADYAGGDEGSGGGGGVCSAA